MALRRAQQQAEKRADRLFLELDNRQIEDASGDWVAQVLGIHIAQRDVWVQIAPADAPRRSLLLHLSSRATATHAIVALSAWSKTPTPERVRVIEVIPHRNPARQWTRRRESDPLAA